MKLSAFVGVTNPEYWQFPYLEALRSYCDLADEVIVVDGGSTDGSLEEIDELSKEYPNKIKVIHSEWKWTDTVRQVPIHYNKGLDACTGDWAIKLDIDYVFHENDLTDYRDRLLQHDRHENILAMYCSKFNIYNRGQYYNKGSVPIALHKKFIGDKVRIGVHKGNDRCDWAIPIIVDEIIDEVPYGLPISHTLIKHTGVPVYNYDCTFRDEDRCRKWFNRTAKAYRDETGYPLYGKDDDDAWKQWLAIRETQKKTASFKSISIDEHGVTHPKYIREKLTNMTSEMWGYDNWNL